MNNNTNYTEEQLFEIYGKVPEDIQSMIRDENLGPAIQVIGKDHGITPAQALDVEDVVLHTLLGTKPANNFARQIQEKLGISEEVAQKIAGDIDENIFSAVKESLGEIQEVKHQEPTVPQPPKEAPQIPQVPPLRKPEPAQPSTLPSRIIKKKPVPYEGVPTQIAPPTPPTPPAFHKPIVGAEKVGIGIPPLEPPQEHMFEQKLRETVQPDAPKPASTTIPQIQTETEQEGEEERKPLVETPSYGTDPYKEPIE